MVSLQDHLLSFFLFPDMLPVNMIYISNLRYSIPKVFFDITDPRISPDKLCQVLEQRNVLAMPASSKRLNSVNVPSPISRKLTMFVKPDCLSTSPFYSQYKLNYVC